MKRKLTLAALFICAACMFFSCNKEDDLAVETTDLVSVSFGVDLPGQLKDGGLEDEPVQVDCSLQEGYTVMLELKKVYDGSWTKELELGLIASGGSFVTEVVELRPDEYYVSKCIVMNGQDYVAATPEEGSVYASYVQDPINIYFDVESYAKEKLDIQVLCFEEHMAADFGFEWFDISVIKAEWFCIFVNLCHPGDEMYHEVAKYNINVWNNNVLGYPEEMYYDGANFVEGGEGHVFCFPLPGPNERVNGLTLQMDIEGWGEEFIFIRPEQIQEYFDAEDEFYEIRLGCDPDPICVYYNNIDQSNISELFHVVPNSDASTMDFTSLRTFEDGKYHIGVDPLSGYLFMFDSGDNGDMVVYDPMYDVIRKTFNVAQPSADPDNIVQVVITADRTIFVGSNSTDNVYSIGFSADESDFGFTQVGTVTTGIEGGDLIADENGDLISITRDGAGSIEVVTGAAAGTIVKTSNNLLSWVNGACVWNDMVITAINPGGSYMGGFSVWDQFVSDVYPPTLTGDPVSVYNGDMASCYFLPAVASPQ